MTEVLVGLGSEPLAGAVRRAHRDRGRRFRPGLEHRWTADRLAEHAARLARENEALKDFAGLVAHEVRSSLLSAMIGNTPQEGLTRALELVDSILEAVRAEGVGGVTAVPDCVEQAVADLGDIRAEIVTSVAGEFPIPSAALSIVLRNLLANAVAAGAGRIHVSALARGDRQVLVVDDDGAGLGSGAGYATGAQLGLALCRRLVARFGGTLELKPRALGGTRALIVLTGAGG